MRRIRLIPAVLVKTFDELENKIRRTYKNTKLIQIDICDGVFVPSKTICSGAYQSSILRIKNIIKKYKINLEVDLMVDFKKKPQKWLNALNMLEPKRIIFHLDSVKD